MGGNGRENRRKKLSGIEKLSVIRVSFRYGTKGDKRGIGLKLFNLKKSYVYVKNQLQT
jgi:hypothetical protein